MTLLADIIYAFEFRKNITDIYLQSNLRSLRIKLFYVLCQRVKRIKYFEMLSIFNKMRRARLIIRRIQIF